MQRAPNLGVAAGGVQTAAEGEGPGSLGCDSARGHYRGTVHRADDAPLTPALQATQDESKARHGGARSGTCSALVVRYERRQGTAPISSGRPECVVRCLRDVS
jgi:hypothetical protein